MMFSLPHSLLGFMLCIPTMAIFFKKKSTTLVWKALSWCSHSVTVRSCLLVWSYLPRQRLGCIKVEFINQSRVKQVLFSRDGFTGQAIIANLVHHKAQAKIKANKCKYSILSNLPKEHTN